MKRMIPLLLLACLIWGCGQRPATNTTEAVETTKAAIETGAVVETDVQVFPDAYEATYREALENHTLGGLDVVETLVDVLGAAGFTAVDYENQVDMVNPEQVERFARNVESKTTDQLSILCVQTSGDIVRYDLTGTDGAVTVKVTNLSWKNQELRATYEEEYPANTWLYTENGYLFFDQYHMPGICWGHTAIRVEPLDETCRELNRTYIRPAGYTANTLFVSDWSADDYGGLDVTGLYDSLYQMKYGTAFLPQTADDGTASVIPAAEFEDVITNYIEIPVQNLRELPGYRSEEAAYEYHRETGSGSELPFPEVVDYKQNTDGTLTLTVNAVWPEQYLEKAFSHEVLIRPLEDQTFRYLYNRVIPSSDNKIPDWE